MYHSHVIPSVIYRILMQKTPAPTSRPPNPALQLTASRARSLVFEFVFYRALAAAERQAVQPSDKR
jgi:hypothetical protein